MRCYLLLAMLLATGCTRQSRPVPPHRGVERPELPVRWTDQLIARFAGKEKLKSVTQVDALLLAPLEACCTSGAIFRHETTKKAFTPKSCRDFLEMDKDYRFDMPAVDVVIYANLYRHCRALAWLKRAKPSRRSFVVGFDLGRDWLRALPPVVGNLWAGADAPETKRRIELTRKGARYAAVAKGYVVEKRTRDFLALRTKVRSKGEAPGADLTFTVLAYGDVDGDQVEDLLLYVTEASGGPSVAFAFELYTLTRDTPDGVLRVVKLRQ